MTDFNIRSYLPSDREAVSRIAADTAFFGEPVEAFMEDRKLFCDFFYSYYTDREPEHIWLAAASGTVVGFLAGSTDPRGRQRHVSREILPLAGNFLRGKYRLGKKTFHYVIRLASGRMRGEHPAIDLANYPAHLHVNVAAA